MRMCSKCKVEKSLDEFYKNKKATGGHTYYCKECQRGYVADKNGGYKLKKLIKTDTHKQCRMCLTMIPLDSKTYCQPCISESQRIRHLKVKYGISIDDYNALLIKQAGKCGICKKEKDETLCVDHDHETGVVRGLLCTSCNKAIGLLGDTRESLQSALDYLDSDFINFHSSAASKEIL